MAPMKKMMERRTTLILAGLTLLALIVSVPGSLREAFLRGELYLFSIQFFEDIPRRLVGPGRFRFVMQPLTAIILGILNGRADARSGNPPYLSGLLFHRERRRELAWSGFSTVVNLLLMGILLDFVFQWIILGAAYPGAALVIGPVLVAFPYAVSRALSNRITRHARHFK